MYLISGKLYETLYDINDSNIIRPIEGNIINKGNKSYKLYQTLHRIDALEKSVSLHIYCPGYYQAKYYDFLIISLIIKVPACNGIALIKA